MRILALETSAHVAGVAILDDEKLLGEMTVNHPRTHSEKLMPLVASLLENLELDMTAIDRIAVAAGPGSFTGIRIGMSAAKGLAHPHGIPIAEISTLEGLALNGMYFDGLIAPLMDARRSQVYTGLYRWDKGRLVTVEKERAIAIDDWLEILAHHKGSIFFTGDGLPPSEEKIVERLGSRAVFAEATNNRQRAAHIAWLAARMREEDLAESGAAGVTYLRKSQAEREREDK